VPVTGESNSPPAAPPRRSIAYRDWLMTWVFGSPTWLGSSVCLADIQVTVGDDTFDCLRKLYGLDQNVVAGFAGNVKTGFAMLASLQRFIDDTKPSASAPADIQAIFDHFPDAARDLFASLADYGRQGGSAVLVAGAEPAANHVYGSRSRAARFLSPEFSAQEIPHQAWASIGSGAEIPEYQAELEKVTGDESLPLITMEAGRPGGHAHTMAIAVMQSVGDLPSVRGISKHFHVGVVFAGGWEFTSSNRDFFPPDGPPQQIRMPPVAESWRALERLLAPYLSQALTVAIAA
jgi:hypothetical protein